MERGETGSATGGHDPQATTQARRRWSDRRRPSLGTADGPGDRARRCLGDAEAAAEWFAGHGFVELLRTMKARQRRELWTELLRGIAEARPAP